MMKSSGVLKKAARRAGLTQAEVARSMKVSEAAVCRLFQGVTRPKPHNARKLAKLLGLTLDEIYS